MIDMVQYRKKENGRDIDMDKFISWFLKLDDRVIGEIEFSKVDKAKQILERIKKRDSYVKLGEIQDSDREKLVSQVGYHIWASYYGQTKFALTLCQPYVTGEHSNMK